MFSQLHLHRSSVLIGVVGPLAWTVDNPDLQLRPTREVDSQLHVLVRGSVWLERGSTKLYRGECFACEISLRLERACVSEDMACIYRGVVTAHFKGYQRLSHLQV
jgi:hypothetical protein